jgi:hypothetical protein
MGSGHGEGGDLVVQQRNRLQADLSTMRAMIEVKGEQGESILFDGSSVAKFRHDGQQEVARNPASTYREVRIKPKKRKKRDPEQRYDVLLACSSIFSLTIPESEKPKLDELVAELERLASTS